MPQKEISVKEAKNMKKILKFLINRPIFVLLILTTIIFVPPLVVMQAQSQKKLIIRTLGVDVVGEGIEVTAVCYQPSNSQTFNENYTLISAKGKNLTTALDKVGDYAGKQIGLAHLSEVVVSNDFAENNLLRSLNYLIRTYPTNNSTNIINTNVSAKEFLQETLKTEGRKVGQESGIVEHNNQFVVGQYSSLEDLVSSAYKPSKTTLIDILRIGESGLDLSGEGETGGTGGGEGDSGVSKPDEKSKSKFLESDGSVAIIYDGNKVGEFSREEILGINWINPKTEWTKLELDNFTDENANNAKVVLNVNNKEIKYDTYFEEGKPVVVANIKLKATIFEIVQEEQTEKMYFSNEMFFTTALKNAISKKISEEFFPVYEKAQSLNADIFNFHQLFNKRHTQEFKDTSSSRFSRSCTRFSRYETRTIRYVFVTTLFFFFFMSPSLINFNSILRAKN